jgi:PrtD family type I secretion system ABC transporter
MPSQTPSAGLLRACTSGFAWIGLFSCVINLLQLVSPLFMMQIYDRVLSSGSHATLLGLTAVAVFLLLVGGLLEAVRSRMFVRVSGRLEARFGQRVLRGAYQEAVGARPLAARNVQDFETLRSFLTGGATLAFFDAPWIPIYLLIVWALHPILGAIALGGALLLIAATLLAEWLTKRPLAEAQQQAARASQFLDQGLREAGTIEAMGMFGSFGRRWYRLRELSLTLQAQASDSAGLLSSLTKLVRVLLQTAILAVGAWLAIKGQITGGAIMGASILVGRGLAPVEQLVGAWRQVVGARVAYARVKTLLAAHPDAQTKTSLPRPKGLLTVEKLAVGESAGGRTILRNINLQLPAGRILAIVGPSGSGKSTLLRTLVGAQRPQVGVVRLDQADIHAWDREELGPHIGYLPQEIALFEGSVAENIARFAPANSEMIVKAALAADVHELVLRMPDGYETEVGSSGIRLSVGQRQRIALARALYGEPAFLVLDEPDAHLDETGDKALCAALEQARARGSTVVLVSHRQQLLAIADHVAVLRDGQLGPVEGGAAREAEPPRRAAIPLIRGLAS